LSVAFRLESLHFWRFTLKFSTTFGSPLLGHSVT
jgi:hypothetical protein